jgi:glycosyltransferase involved in cell wall biosynthesis
VTDIQKMRIAFVTNLATHYRLPLFRLLAQRFDMSYFFTSSGARRYWLAEHRLAYDGLEVVPARTSATLAWRLLNGRYDCTVVALAGRLKLLVTVVAVLAARSPFVLWVGIWDHPQTLFHRLSRPLVRRLYRSADAVVVYGPHVAEHVARESGRTDGVFVAAQAVDNARFSAEVADDALRAARARLIHGDGFVATFVGRLVPEKGLETLIDAVARTNDMHLALVGSGPLRGELERRVADRGLTGRVTFVGYVDQEDLPPLLSASDIVVLPSETTKTFKEPWGLIANEAFNAARPVVATSAVGAVAGGLVTDGETGLVVPERDARALANALQVLVGDPELRARLGDAGRARVASWTFTAAADGFSAAIAAALNGRGA